MSSIKSAMNKWLGNDVSHMGSCAVCEASAVKQGFLTPTIESQPIIVTYNMTIQKDNGQTQMVPDSLSLTSLLTQAVKATQDSQTKEIKIYQVGQADPIWTWVPGQSIVHDNLIEISAMADRILGKSPMSQETINLGNLESGDIFVLQGFDRKREFLRRHQIRPDYAQIVTKDVENLSIEEMPARTKVIKVGHKSGKPTVCDGMPKDTTTEMRHLSITSYENLREQGAVITDDYVLGEVAAGSRDRVDIPRKGENIIGTFHTHPDGNSSPGDYDLIDFLNHNDKLMCICATGIPGTKCQCYTPHEPTFTSVRQELNTLVDDIRKYNKATHSRYGLKGKSLRKLLRGVATDAYLKSGLPYEVETRGPLGAALPTRRVMPAESISIEVKQSANQEMIAKDTIAKQREAEYVIWQNRIDQLIAQINDLQTSLDSLRDVAGADGNYITIHRVDQINDITGIGALKTAIEPLARVYSFGGTVSGYYTFGSIETYRDTTRRLRNVNDAIKDLRRQLENVGLPVMQRNTLIDEVNEFYQRRSELVAQQWLTKPAEYNVEPPSVIVLVNESITPIENNQAAANLAPMDKNAALAMINRREVEIKDREKRYNDQIDAISANIERLIGKQVRGVGYVGGQAQQYRDIAVDKTKSQRDRATAVTQLDIIDRTASNAKKVLKEVREAQRMSRYSPITVTTFKYGDDIEGLMYQIAQLTGQLHDIQANAQRALNLATEARDDADEARATFETLAKDRVAEYNAAVAVINEGANLETRRQAFINKLRDYERQAGINPSDSVPQDHLFDSCRLVWEQETLDQDTREVDLDIVLANLVKDRTVRVKTSGKTGLVDNIVHGIYLVKVEDQTLELTTDEIEFMD